jgi:LacI family transcriptional regulator
MQSRPRVLFIPEWIDFEADLGVAAYAREAHWVLTGITHHGGGLGIPGQYADGIITLVNREDSPQAQLARQARVPVVDMVNEVPAIGNAHVLADNDAIGRMAAGHLMDQGLEHLAFLSEATSRVARERRQGFTAAVEQRGRSIHNLYAVDTAETVHEGTSFEPRVDLIARQLRRLPKPLGVMLQFDGDVGYMTEACKQAGLTIPEQVAVVGVDNCNAICEWGELPLSSVDSNRRRHGYEAAALLDRLMAGEAAPKAPIRIAPARVVARKSSDVLAISDPDVKKAVEFIRNHWSDPDLGALDVVRATAVSRCKLYKLFEKHMDRGVTEVLTLYRVTEAKRLLRDTDMKLYTVAMRSGFSGPDHLMRVFKRVVGVTASTFRAGGSR